MEEVSTPTEPDEVLGQLFETVKGNLASHAEGEEAALARQMAHARAVASEQMASVPGAARTEEVVSGGTSRRKKVMRYVEAESR